MKHLRETMPIRYEKNDRKDASVELFTGKFPHGGTLLAKFYIDSHGASCPKEKAYACIEREMKGHEILHQERILLDSQDE